MCVELCADTVDVSLLDGALAAVFVGYEAIRFVVVVYIEPFHVCLVI